MAGDEPNIVRELQRLEDRLKGLDEKLDMVRTIDLPGIRVDVAGLKVKAGIWGAAAGLLGSMGALLVAAMLR